MCHVAEKLILNGCNHLQNKIFIGCAIKLKPFFFLLDKFRNRWKQMRYLPLFCSSRDTLYWLHFISSQFKRDLKGFLYSIIRWIGVEFRYSHCYQAIFVIHKALHVR